MLEATPFDRYQALVQEAKLESNSQQEAVLKYLAKIRHRLILRQKLPWRSKFTIQGLYLWGGVGAGKTMLMDFFYESLTVTKTRLHFHAFMQHLHEELNRCQGQINPLTAIAKRLADQYAVICFDEFLVNNVADAMLLAELFKTLFKGGICLVATSNLPPEQLYENGLQRDRFLPVITLIKKHTQVMHLLLVHDYRRRQLEQISAYFMPLGLETEQAMRHAWQHVATGSLSQAPVLVLKREIPIIQRTEQAIWFEFSILCGRPRSVQDYMVMAEHYSVVMISNVPCLETVSKDKVVSFINLVDVLYDAKVRLIISAAVEIEKLYTQGGFRQGFQRTESRLIEMQSKEYLIKTS